jgi:predicted GNAT superfamily acetyltransferase
MHVFFGRAVLRGMRVDRVVVDWDCVVALSYRVEDARPTALGDEVPRTVDVAVGPSFRGAHKPYSLTAPNPQPHRFPFFSFITPFADYHANRWVGHRVRS